MANQYQIYEASLTAMCNMYRMANDSNEPIAIGELANKIRNYHKNPIYPEGCTIIDDIILIDNGKVLCAGNKFEIYENCNINKPFTIKIKDAIYEKSKINIGNNDNINELIKAIYREIR